MSKSSLHLPDNVKGSEIYFSAEALIPPTSSAPKEVQVGLVMKTGSEIHPVPKLNSTPLPVLEKPTTIEAETSPSGPADNLQQAKIQVDRRLSEDMLKAGIIRFRVVPKVPSQHLKDIVSITLEGKREGESGVKFFKFSFTQFDDGWLLDTETRDTPVSTVDTPKKRHEIAVERLGNGFVFTFSGKILKRTASENSGTIINKTNLKRSKPGTARTITLITVRTGEVPTKVTGEFLPAPAGTDRHSESKPPSTRTRRAA